MTQSVKRTGKHSLSVNVPTGVQPKSATPDNAAKAEFDRLDGLRHDRVQIWRDCSALTIPTLLPPEGHNGHEALPTPYQGLGARAVNTLASKLTLVLLPPAAPFFKQQVDKSILSELTKDNPEAADVIKQQLITDAAIINDSINESNARVALFRALRHEIVTGQGLLYMPDKPNTLKVIRPDKFVVQRDGEGTFTKLIVKEIIDPVTEIDPEKRALLEDAMQQGGKVSASVDAANDTDIYTVVQLIASGKYLIWQETSIGTVLTKAQEVDKADCPYLPPLRWTIDDESDYGVGHVQDYLGDWRSYEGFSEMALKGAASLGKVLTLLNPNGTTNIDDLVNSETGDVIAGNEEDVHTLSSDGKVNDLITAIQSQVGPLSQRLQEAFLMTSAIQRQAERVTAEEIRTLAEDLDSSLGGMFSAQSLDFQRPFLARKIRILEKQKKLTNYGSDVVKPKIITGLEALGRGHELAKLQDAVGLVMSVPGAEVYIDKGGYAARIFEKLGVEADGLLLSNEQVQEMQEAQQLDAAVAEMAPGLTQEAVKQQGK